MKTPTSFISTLTNRVALLLLALMVVANHPALGQDSAAMGTGFKQVPFDEGMKQQLNRSMPLTLGFPTNYEMLVIDPAIRGVIWGTADELEEAKRTTTLPAKNGFFWGRLTINVGYDRASGSFICGPSCNESDIEKGYSKIGAKVVSDKAVANGIPLYFLEIDMSSVQNSPVKTLYMVYMATMIETNAMLISYRPAPTSEDQGRSIWNYFKKSLKESH